MESVMEPLEKVGMSEIVMPLRSARSTSMRVLSRCYEVHKYLNGRWELAAVFDDRDEAIADAKSMFDVSKYSMGVRVLHVVAREDQNQDVTFAEQTIFRQSTVDEHNAEASARLLKAWQEVEAARESRRRERMAREPVRRAKLTRLGVILGLTVLAWLVVMAMILRYQGVY